MESSAFINFSSLLVFLRVQPRLVLSPIGTIGLQLVFQVSRVDE